MTKLERVLHMGAAVILYAALVYAAISTPDKTTAGIAIFVSFVETVFWGAAKKMRGAGFAWAGLVVFATLTLLIVLSNVKFR